MTWDFFSEKELRCKCGCGRADMHPIFMDRLVAIRKSLDFPFILSSAFRCPEHNDRVSSTGLTGPHTTGRAVDIQVFGHLAFLILSNAPLRGFSGIGISQKGNHGKRFIHLDDLSENPGPRPWVWSY